MLASGRSCAATTLHSGTRLVGYTTRDAASTAEIEGAPPNEENHPSGPILAELDFFVA
jgi:hypothetical protein